MNPHTKDLQPKVELTVGERLTLPQFSAYRTLYPIYEAGNLLGFVGTQTGWGKPWRLYPLERLWANTAQKLKTTTQLDGFAPDAASWVNVVDVKGNYATGKEVAFALALAMLGDKRHRAKFKTVPELNAQAAKLREANQRTAADKLASAIKAHAAKIEEHNLLLQIADGWSKGHAVGGNKCDLNILDRMLTELTDSTEARRKQVESARELVKTFEGKVS
jgi:hypothetical protein